MSSGQRPRWPQFYPRMKHRGKGRRRGTRIITYNSAWEPVHHHHHHQLPQRQNMGY